MAFAERFDTNVEDPAGNTWDLEIYWDGYSGSVTELKLAGEDPFIVQTVGGDEDPLHPIIGLEFIVRVVCETEDEFELFAEAGHKQAYLQAEISADWKYRAWLMPEDYSEPYKGAPYYVDLHFTDGLGDLKGE